MASENPMPAPPFHICGLSAAALLSWASYEIWLSMPKLVDPTVFQEFRIVGAMLAVFLLLTIARAIEKRLMKAVAKPK